MPPPPPPPGLHSPVLGYYLAASMDVAIAGMMAVVAGGLFSLALLFSPSRGLVANLLRNRRNRRSFSRKLLLARLLTLGNRATEAELSENLGWEAGRVSRALTDALRGGLVLKPAAGEVTLTRKGREAATGPRAPVR